MKKTSVRVNFPSQFVQFVGYKGDIEFSGEKVSDFLSHLDHTYGNISERILDGDQIRPYLNLYIGKTNINNLQGLDTVIPKGESVSLLLSRAGG